MDNSYSDPTNQENLDNPIEPENNVPTKTPVASSLSYIIKSMGGTKGISALFGMLLLAGGVGAGIILVTQPQLLEQQAAVLVDYAKPAGCGGATCGLDQYCALLANGIHTCVTGTNNCGLSGHPCTNSQYCLGNQCVSLCGGVACGLNQKCGTTVNGTITCVSNTCGLSGIACPFGATCIGNQCVFEGCVLPNVNVQGVCVPPGNCQLNTAAGNTGRECFVTTQIGIEENPGTDGIRNICDGPHWTTCEVGYVCRDQDCWPSDTTGPTSPPGTGSNPTPTPPITLVTASPSPTPTASPSPTPSATPSPTPSATPSPTPTPIVAQCVSTNIYTPAWSPVTIADFYNLPAGAQVYFCTQGTTNGLTFDKARFTINGVLRPEVTLQRPNGTDFCDLYTIPANTYSFTVQGEIHHTTLGWL